MPQPRTTIRDIVEKTAIKVQFKIKNTIIHFRTVVLLILIEFINIYVMFLTQLK